MHYFRHFALAIYINNYSISCLSLFDTWTEHFLEEPPNTFQCMSSTDATQCGHDA